MIGATLAPVRADHIGASTFVEKGWSLLSVGKLPEAEAALMRAVELSPNDSATEALLGWALMLQDKHDEALRWFQGVLLREPRNELVRVNVGFICVQKRIYGEAIEHLASVLREGTDRKALMYARFYLGVLYLEREMYADARAFLAAALDAAPNFTQAQFELGRACALQGDMAAARDAWTAGAAARFSPWGKRCQEALAS